MEDAFVQIEEKKGAVTFLDVLGWKGIWEKNKEAIYELQDLIVNIRTKGDKITREYLVDKKDRGESTTVLSISDTIAIFTPGNVYKALSIHAALCNYAIPESIARRIPVRGATAYGAFSTMKNIMVGPAVDESASWHEATDWIGVVLTPSATFMLEHGRTPDGWIEYPKIPFKRKVDGLVHCVDWDWDTQKNGELGKLFYDMGPHVPEIAPKYLNTLAFFTFKEKQEHERQKEHTM